MSTFDLARAVTTHLVVQPADARLNPPESYYFVQDGLIISCGVSYALCYFCYMTRTFADKKSAGAIEYTALTQAYEIFYAFTTTSTSFEFWCFLIWFLLDFTFAMVTIFSATPLSKRAAVIFRMFTMFITGLCFLKVLTVFYPDDREQLTAYWTGLALQFPIGWASLFLLLKDGETRGHSLEIWITRYIGCWTAYAVFAWRYLNNPVAWIYVGSDWSKWTIILTMIPETIYPFVYVWTRLRNSDKVKKI